MTSTIIVPILAVIGYLLLFPVAKPAHSRGPALGNAHPPELSITLADPLYSIVVRGVTYKELEGLTFVVPGAAVTVSIPALAQEAFLTSAIDGSYRVIFSSSDFPSGTPVEVRAVMAGYYLGASFGHLGENGSSQFIVLDVPLRPLQIAPQLYIPLARRG
ncbi:MAG: hypothetical protein EXR62_18290 [Chloroflexi bacterium]|nr:hypothetical protein [Chloroflexota bacterium]